MPIYTIRTCKRQIGYLIQVEIVLPLMRLCKRDNMPTNEKNLPLSQTFNLLAFKSMSLINKTKQKKKTVTELGFRKASTLNESVFGRFVLCVHCFEKDWDRNRGYTFKHEHFCSAKLLPDTDKAKT